MAGRFFRPTILAGAVLAAAIGSGQPVQNAGSRTDPARAEKAFTAGQAAAKEKRWNDAIEETSELQLIVKTTRFRAQAAMAHVKALHPFEVPELIVVGVSDGAEAYLSWIERETTPA